MVGYLTTSFIATSLRTEDEEIKIWFEDILRSLSIEPVIGDEPETTNIPQKVKRMISEYPNFIAILTKRDDMRANLAAIKALATEGIQRGHMSLHARTLQLSRE